jgi:hypothetical protein
VNCCTKLILIFNDRPDKPWTPILEMRGLSQSGARCADCRFHPFDFKIFLQMQSNHRVDPVLLQCLLELSMLKQGPGDSQEAKQLLLQV